MRPSASLCLLMPFITARPTTLITLCSGSRQFKPCIVPLLQLPARHTSRASCGFEAADFILSLLNLVIQILAGIRCIAHIANGTANRATDSFANDSSRHAADYGSTTGFNGRTNRTTNSTTTPSTYEFAYSLTHRV